MKSINNAVKNACESGDKLACKVMKENHEKRRVRYQARCQEGDTAACTKLETFDD